MTVMHNYLRAVGFSKCKKKRDVEKIVESIIKEPDRKIIVKQDGQSTFGQLDKCFGEDFGISICGEYDEDGRFEFDYYYPFFYGYEVTIYEEPGVERHAEKESYAGLCDDFRVGIAIIFYVNNTALYKKRLQTNMSSANMDGVSLSGLAAKGKVLLPVNKTEKQKLADKEAVQQRSQLIRAARQGDEKAIENLTLEDLDMFSMVGRRIGKEDILSIVETYFMPRGIECDQYMILGEILDYKLEINRLTEEKIYIVKVNCNEIIFHICINEMDLLGELEVGRRLKADIWLQGSLHFEDQYES